MLPWLYMYVASVLFQMFQLFQTYVVASVLSGCCICFTHMLQVFHLDVAYVFQWLHACFPGVFRRMLQLFQLFWTYVEVFCLDVARVDMVLHMLQ